MELTMTCQEMVRTEFLGPFKIEVEDRLLRGNQSIKTWAAIWGIAWENFCPFVAKDETTHWQEGKFISLSYSNLLDLLEIGYLSTLFQNGDLALFLHMQHRRLHNEQSSSPMLRPRLRDFGSPRVTE